MRFTHDITFDVILLLTIFIHMTKVIDNGDKLNVINFHNLSKSNRQLSLTYGYYVT